MITAGAWARQVVAFFSSFAFALALRLSNLSDERRVLAFLLTPAHNTFDSSLVYLAIGAVPLSSLLYRVGKVRVPNEGTIDARLLAGAALFGVGWGIEGICRESAASPRLSMSSGTSHQFCTRSWSWANQIWLGSCRGRWHQAACDLVGCRYRWRLLSAVITHFSRVLPSCYFSYPIFSWLQYIILQDAWRITKCKIHHRIDQH
jgi:hypothetical protein